jgi:hypothetical protein
MYRQLATLDTDTLEVLRDAAIDRVQIGIRSGRLNVDPTILEDMELIQLIDSILSDRSAGK